jgi:hypothetical protein
MSLQKTASCREIFASFDDPGGYCFFWLNDAQCASSILALVYPTFASITSRTWRAASRLMKSSTTLSLGCQVDPSFFQHGFLFVIHKMWGLVYYHIQMNKHPPN